MSEEDTASPDEAPDEEATEEDEPLGEAGKKALAAERANVRAAKREAREAKQELAALRAQLEAKDQPAAEQELERVRREAATEAARASDARLVRAELKAALAGKVTDPARVLRLIDPTGIEIGEDGEADQAAIADAIDTLLTEFPELKATRSPGSADQFTKGRQPAKPDRPNPNDLLRAALQSS